MSATMVKTDRMGRRYTERPLRGGVVERVYEPGAGVPITRPGPPIGVTGNGRQGRSSTSSLRPVRRVTGAPSVRVRMMDRALDQIKRRTFWASGFDGLETGGFLSGTWLGDAVVITGATVSDTRRKPRSVGLDTYALSGLDLDRRWGFDVGAIGSWHVHPLTGPESRCPSDADFAMAETLREYVWTDEKLEGRFEPFTVMMIATPDDDGSYAYPVLSAWATERDSNGRHTTEPARIELY